jgi:polyisoprenoid-binding protein YceI
MKKLSFSFRFIILSIFLGVFLINSCTHDDDDIILIDPSTFEYGEDVVSNTDGFNFDKSHSSVRWETAYLGTAALLTGRFNSFAFTTEFDQNDLEGSSVTGSVTLSTVNTGEPGRDAGCLLNTFATAVSDEASFASTSITEDGKGAYIIKGDLTFHGVTSEVAGTLEYVGTEFFDVDSGINGAPLSVAGIIITFEMNAKTIFGIESGSIADRVVVIASGQFKKPA